MAARSTKFSTRIIRWCVREILRRNGEATTYEIKGELAAKYRNCPTSYQLGQILSRSGFFEPLGTTNQKNLVSNSSVMLWGLQEDECAQFEWYQSEVDAVIVWQNARGGGGSPRGGWDAPRRIGNGKGKPRKSRKSDSETDNNTVE